MWLTLLKSKTLWSILVFVVIVGGSFYAGCSYNEQQHTIADLKAKNEAAVALQKEQHRVNEVVDRVDARLKELHANEKVIEKWRTKIVERPIYQLECIDTDGLRAIESARTGKAADQSKSTGTVPGVTGSN
jgi:hypothetical protein